MGELSLDVKITSRTGKNYVNCTVAEFLEEVSRVGSVEEKLRMFHDYINRLEDELRKIDAFKRELPLCMLLLTHAIMDVKEEEMKCRKLNVEPVLEEFIPLNKSCDQDDDKEIEVRKESDDPKEKMDWLSSMQLWNSSGEHQMNQDLKNNRKNSKQDIRKRIDDEVHSAVLNVPIKSHLSQSMGNGLLQFNGYSGFPYSASRSEEKENSPGLSLQTPGMKNITDDILVSRISGKSSATRSCSSSFFNGQTNLGRGSQVHQPSIRKQRRCWSPDLHRRFIEALQQLGGSQVATPKQIRDLMKVEGLTNDEVKSHLQKYRLHARRAPAASCTVPNQSTGSGDLWSSQDQFGENLKLSNSHSSSPQGPLHFSGTSQGTSVTGGENIHAEDEEKSESYSWKYHAHSSETSNV